MPRPGPRKAPDVFRLSDEQRDWLTAEAERRGVSRADIVRELIDKAMRRKRS